MKVLQINNVYNFGSTGKITYDIHHMLPKFGIESVVCYGRRYETSDENVYKVCPEWYSKLNNLISRFTGIMYGGCLFSTKRIITLIEKEKPDIVHLQCLNGYFVNIYKLLNYLKKNNIPTVLTLHAEFMYTGGCGIAFDCEQWCKQEGNECYKCSRYRKETKSVLLNNTHRMFVKMKKSFENFDNLTVVSVSPWLMERAKKSSILGDKEHCVIYNGLDTDVFRLRSDEEIDKIMLKYAIPHDKKIVFHATTRFDDNKDNIKGGYHIIQIAKDLPEYLFVIAGEYDNTIEYPNNIVTLGAIMDKVELATLYSMADVTIIASKRETFSMIVAESLCCGTPVVGFKAGGPEMIGIKKYSSFTTYGDNTELENQVQKTLYEKYEKSKISEYSINVYCKEKMIQQYLTLYKTE